MSVRTRCILSAWTACSRSPDVSRPLPYETVCAPGRTTAVALKRALRLRKNQDFQLVRQQGRVVTSRLLILSWAPNQRAETRVGFVVSKRISKLAVQRNYSKRLLSEAIRPYLSELSGGWDVVMSAKGAILDTNLPALTQDVGMLLRRAHLLDISPEARR